MLIEGFYKVVEKEVSDIEITVSIVLNPEHPIYKGHFPERAVVPGVLLLQIVRELIEEHCTCTTTIEKVKQIKFFIPVLPKDNGNLRVTFDLMESEVMISKFRIEWGDQIFTKGSLILKANKT